jgi:hypothetical protein
MSLNISKETKVGRVSNYSTEAHINGEISSYLVVLEENDGVVTKLTREQFYKFMNENNLMVSSNGILYKKPIKNIVGKVLRSK